MSSWSGRTEPPPAARPSSPVPPSEPSTPSTAQATVMATPARKRSARSSRRTSLKISPVGKSPSVLSLSSGLPAPALAPMSFAPFPSRAAVAPALATATPSAPSVPLPSSPSSSGPEEVPPLAKHPGPTTTEERARAASVPSRGARSSLEYLMATHARASKTAGKVPVPRQADETATPDSETKAAPIDAPPSDDLDLDQVPEVQVPYRVRRVPARARRFSAPPPLSEGEEVEGYRVTLALQAGWSLDLLSETRVWQLADRVASLTWKMGRKSLDLAQGSVSLAREAGETLVHPTLWPRAAGQILTAPSRLAWAILDHRRATAVDEDAPGAGADGAGGPGVRSGVSDGSHSRTTARSLAPSGQIVLAQTTLLPGTWGGLRAKWPLAGGPVSGAPPAE